MNWAKFTLLILCILATSGLIIDEKKPIKDRIYGGVGGLIMMILVYFA